MSGRTEQMSENSLHPARTGVEFKQQRVPLYQCRASGRCFQTLGVAKWSGRRGAGRAQRSERRAAGTRTEQSAWMGYVSVRLPAAFLLKQGIVNVIVTDYNRFSFRNHKTCSKTTGLSVGVQACGINGIRSSRSGRLGALRA